MASWPSKNLTSHWHLLRQTHIIVFYCFLIIIVPRLSSCQQLDSAELSSYQLTYLLSIELEETNILRVTATPESRERYMNSFVDKNEISWPEPISWLIPDVSLPPECGPEYFRCRELLILQLDKESTAIFVPLENGMLLLYSLYNVSTLTLEWQSFVVNSSDCSPTVVYKTENKVFTVCISSVNNYIAVYELQVHRNRSLIHDVMFVEPMTRVSITNISNSYLSNFVLMLSRQEHKVFFAIDSSIYVMDVLNPSQTKRYPELPGCDRVHSLSSVPGGPLLLAYCSDRFVYYDTVYGDWTRIHNYSRYGIPYLCPNGNYNITFFNDTQRSLQFSVANSNPMIIDNVDVTSGICFEVGNTTYFVWSDQQQNTISVFDFATQTHYLVASYECLTMDCPQLLLLANQYVVYDEDSITYVLNSETDFILIFNISSRVSDILTTVLNISIPYYYASNRTTTMTVHTTPPANSSTADNHNNVIILTITVVAGIVIIGVLVSIIAVAMSALVLRKRQTRYTIMQQSL